MNKIQLPGNTVGIISQRRFSCDWIFDCAFIGSADEYTGCFQYAGDKGLQHMGGKRICAADGAACLSGRMGGKRQDELRDLTQN